MINELFELSKTLQNNNIETKNWHKDYLNLPNVSEKAPLIRIWITSTGDIGDIDTINSELAQKLRKYGNNQSTFPAFNIVPLFVIKKDEDIRYIENLKKKIEVVDINKLKKLCIESNWPEKIIDKMKRNLTTKPKELLEKIEACNDSEYILLQSLCNITMKYDVYVFYNKLYEYSIKKISEKENINIFLALLFNCSRKENENEKNDIGTNISAFVDFFSWKDLFKYPVSSERMTEWINKKLIENLKHDVIGNYEMGKDAFNNNYIYPKETMPKVRLGALGDVTLRSMFHEQVCQRRYSTIDDESYPISLENRTLVKNALSWIIDGKNENVTWKIISKDEIFFAYPSKQNCIPLKFICLFSTDKTESKEQHDNLFKKQAEAFLRTLDGISQSQQPKYINIFSLRKIDKARTKIELTKMIETKKLLTFADEWEKGGENIPEMGLNVTHIPFPLQVSKIINNIWKRNGNNHIENTTVERMKNYQGIEFFLNLYTINEINNYFHSFITNIMGLIYYTGNIKHSTNKIRLTYDISLSLSLIGIFLYKKGERKDKYMEKEAFLIGQILKISDQLHALYCEVVRNNEIPTQLVGASLFVNATETPLSALSQLSIRVRPYIDWANKYKYRNEEKSKIARWLLYLYQNVADKLLVSIDDKKKFDDSDKAELFLGYLASFPKKESEFLNNNENKTNAGGKSNE